MTNGDSSAVEVREPGVATRPALGRVRAPRSLMANSATVAVWTLLSRVTGFGRMAVIGAVLGPTFFGNLFQAANQVPNLAFELVAGQLIASLLVPALVRHFDRGDRRGTERVAGGFMGVVMALFGATSVVLAVGAPLLVGLLTIGVDDAGARAAQTSLAWPLITVVMPQLVLYGVIGVANAVQNTRGQYALAAAAPVVENLGVIATLVAYAAIFGGGTEVTSATTDQVLFLGLGSTISVTVHATLQWWGARQAGVTLVPRAGWRDPEVREVLRRAVPSLGLAGVTGYQGFALLIVAARVPGGVVASQMALGFLAAAVAVSARPVAIASLPNLARNYRDGERQAFRTGYRRTLALALFALAPAAAVLAGLGRPLAELVTFGEMSVAEGVALVSAIVPALALACIGEGGTVISQQASYARLDARSPLSAALLRSVILTAGLALAWNVARGPTTLVVLGLAVSAASLAAFARLHLASDRLRAPLRGRRSDPTDRRMTLADLDSLPSTQVARGVALGPAALRASAPGPDPLRLVRRILVTVGAAGLGAAVAFAVARVVSAASGPLAAGVVGLTALAVIYLGGQLLSGAPEVAAMLSKIRSVLRRDSRRNPPSAIGAAPRPGGEPSEPSAPNQSLNAALRSEINAGPVTLTLAGIGAGLFLGSAGGARLAAAAAVLAIVTMVTRTGAGRPGGRLNPLDIVLPVLGGALVLLGPITAAAGAAAVAAYALVRVGPLSEADALFVTWLAVLGAIATTVLGFLLRSSAPPALLVPLTVATWAALATRRAAHPPALNSADGARV